MKEKQIINDLKKSIEAVDKELTPLLEEEYTRYHICDNIARYDDLYVMIFDDNDFKACHLYEIIELQQKFYSLLNK